MLAILFAVACITCS